MKHRVMKHPKLSIRFQILFVCILSLLIMQLILMLNYYQFKQSKINTNSQYFSDLIMQMSESVELNCSYLNGMVENIAYSKVVQDYLSADDITYLQKKYSEVKDFITPIADINAGIKDIAVIGIHDNVVNLNANTSDLQSITSEIPEKILWYYTGLHKISINGNKNSRYFTVGANVYSTSDFTNKEKIGTILITFNMKSIFGFAQNQKNSKLPDMLIYDRNKELVYSSISKGISSSYNNYFDEKGSEKSDTIKQNVTTFYIKTGVFQSLGGKIVFLIPNEELMRGLENTKKNTIVVCIVVFVFMLILSLLVTNNIVVPIKQFMDYLSKVGQGDLRMMKYPIQLHGAAELIIMSEEFNRMMEEINDLSHRLVSTSTRLYESELAKKEAELEYMYSQINPHFLFNTLETIKGCAVDEKADKTFKMINSLGKMFRYCVRAGNIVSVEEEINVINSYMYLQNIRFGSKLHYVCNVSDGILQAAIPKMILQPLIENAVIHGIEEKGAVTVWLDGKVENKILYFYVRDDGTGIDENKRIELIKNMNNKSMTTHIGINNVNNRLRHIYGEEYGVNIEETHGAGFCVSIKFPYEKLQKYDQTNELDN